MAFDFLWISLDVGWGRISILLPSSKQGRTAWLGLGPSAVLFVNDIAQDLDPDSLCEGLPSLLALQFRGLAARMLSVNVEKTQPIVFGTAKFIYRFNKPLVRSFAAMLDANLNWKEILDTFRNTHSTVLNNLILLLKNVHLANIFVIFFTWNETSFIKKKSCVSQTWKVFVVSQIFEWKKISI